jgi:hypothetical protein
VKCRVCGGETEARFSAVILDKHRVQYFQCRTCAHLQTETPYWLEEAYADPIGSSDTGIMARNLHFSRVATSVLYAAFGTSGSFLDHGGGYGIFVRMMRDIGFEFFWQDKYASNLFARGFEYDGTQQITAITAFEVFEHFREPDDELGKLLGISRNILFSTVLLPDPVPAPEKWWYYGLDHGTHVSLYSRRTLEVIAEQHRLRLYSNGRDIHLLTEKKLSRTLFRVLVRGAEYGISAFIRARLHGKTESDYEHLVRTIKSHRDNPLPLVNE